ncbi:MAG: carbon monoxide dehydrogenase subunit G [Pseudomonadales bacterium]|nr:carbon monoxide dehydrogenase subunit G [Pseudomonadales bacterium]
MQQQGEHTINTDLESVWRALNDPAMLKASIPGCESFEQIDAENLKASVRAKVGPVNAVFQVTLALSNVQAPNSYRLNGEVKGGAGVAKGYADVNLEPLPANLNGAATRLVYQVEASVGGKLAQIGSRLIDGAAKKMADDFFASFSEACMNDNQEKANASEAAEPAQATDALQPPAQDKPPVERAKDGTGFIWATAFVVLILAMVLAL